MLDRDTRGRNEAGAVAEAGGRRTRRPCLRFAVRRADREERRIVGLGEVDEPAVVAEVHREKVDAGLVEAEAADDRVDLRSGRRQVKTCRDPSP